MDRWGGRLLTEGEHVAVSVALGRVLLPAELRKQLADEGIQHLVIVPSRCTTLTSFSTLVLGVKAKSGAPNPHYS
jgi:hypothetical protein